MDQLSDRAKRRLRIAAAMMRSEGHVFNCPRDQFYPVIQRAIENLDSAQRVKLKELTDWVEEYELAEERATGRV